METLALIGRYGRYSTVAERLGFSGGAGTVASRIATLHRKLYVRGYPQPVVHVKRGSVPLGQPNVTLTDFGRRMVAEWERRQTA